MNSPSTKLFYMPIEYNEITIYIVNLILRSFPKLFDNMSITIDIFVAHLMGLSLISSFYKPLKVGLLGKRECTNYLQNSWKCLVWCEMLC